MMDKERAVRLFYHRTLQDEEWRYRKTLEDKPVCCLKCGAELEWTYLENRIYGVRCCRCGLVTLTRGKNPQEALVNVGSEMKDSNMQPVNNQFQQFGKNNIQLANVKKIVLTNDDGIVMEEW